MKFSSRLSEIGVSPFIWSKRPSDLLAKVRAMRRELVRPQILDEVKIVESDEGATPGLEADPPTRDYFRRLHRLA